MHKKFPQISGKELGRALLRLGFYLKSQRGSHMKFVRVRDGRKDVVIVPNHTMIRKGALASIVNELHIDSEDIVDFL